MAQERAPRFKLNRKLRVAVHRSAQRLYDLAAQAGFASYTDASSTLNADAVRATPLMVARLRVLATLVGHDPDQIFDPEGVGGPERVFEGDEEPDSFGPDDLPRPR